MFAIGHERTTKEEGSWTGVCFGTAGGRWSSIVCQVVAEDAQGRMRTLAESPKLESGKHEEHAFGVRLPDDCVKLHLVVGDAGEGAACDRADWVNAGFRKK